MAGRATAGQRLGILDLGCGTGLAARAFADVAAWIDGCDLSPAMLARAAATGLYRRLECRDLANVMRQRALADPAAEARPDLIIAADVLVYVGDLGPVLAVAAACLAPGGRFAFTCEDADGGAGNAAPGMAGIEVAGPAVAGGRAAGNSTTSVRRGLAGRFAHSAALIRAEAGAAGFAGVEIDAQSSRQEGGRPVPGLVVVLTR